MLRKDGSCHQAPTHASLRPRIEKQRALGGRRGEGKHAVPAAPAAPAPRISAAEALACWQRSDWPREWEREPSFVLLGRLGDFSGMEGGGHGHTRLRREGSAHRACFVMLDSSSPPPARWDTASAALCLLNKKIISFCLTLIFSKLTRIFLKSPDLMKSRSN